MDMKYWFMKLREINLNVLKQGGLIRYPWVVEINLLVSFKNSQIGMDIDIVLI